MSINNAKFIEIVLKAFGHAKPCKFSIYLFNRSVGPDISVGMKIRLWPA
jgi:hypothetical protein